MPELLPQLLLYRGPQGRVECAVAIMRSVGDGPRHLPATPSRYRSTGFFHGFLLDTDGSFTQIDPPGAFVSDAFGINDAGQIVGEFGVPFGMPNTGLHGFLDTRGSFTQIDPPGALATETAANGINQAGQIVGKRVERERKHYASKRERQREI